MLQAKQNRRWTRRALQGLALSAAGVLIWVGPRVEIDALYGAPGANLRNAALAALSVALFVFSVAQIARYRQ